jgi:hypothetical protein
MEQLIQGLETTWARIVAFLPNLLGAIAILIVGWIIAIVLAKVTNGLLERVGFDKVVQRGRLQESMGDHGSRFDPSRIVGAIVFWAVLITTILLAANALGLEAVSTLLISLVAFLPLVAVAVIAVVVAVALGEIASDALIALMGDRVEGAETIATVTKWAIIAFGIFIALSQLQIAPAIVNGLFLAVVGSLALAFAISFGLGNVELARRLTGDWYNRASGEAEKMDQKKRPAA